MGHMPRNEGKTSHQTALAGKWAGIRQFPSKLLERIKTRNIVAINMEKNSAFILSFNCAKKT